MTQQKNIGIPNDFNLKTIADLVLRNYRLFVISCIVMIGLAFVVNKFSVPIYEVTSSILIRIEPRQGGSDKADYMNSSLIEQNQNIQNELWVLKSVPVIEQAVKNLNLTVNYYRKRGLQLTDAYEEVPFKVLYSPNHIQPINVRFDITFQSRNSFTIKAESSEASFYNYQTDEEKYSIEDWSFQYVGKPGALISTSDLSFIVECDSSFRPDEKNRTYSFEFLSLPAVIESINQGAYFTLKDGNSTVIEINYRSESVKKGIDLVNEIMSVYSQQNLERKNHIASISIDYIDKQLSEISDSLNMTENQLQSFKASNQVLDVSEQANNIATQYVDLQNQQAELMTRKRYYDYVASYIAKNDDFSNITVPASLGIQDPLLNNLMLNLINAQAERSNLLSNKQDKNPLVKKLDIQIENTKKTITENISAVQQTTNIALDEMNKRISQTSAKISSLPRTQRLLGGIERKYRLNDAIYNYLLEKRAEAQITKAANLPDYIVLEPARQVGVSPVSPNPMKNYLISLVLGLGLPFGFVTARSFMKNKIELQEDVEKITSVPVVGKILHNSKKSTNVLFEYPKSHVSESFRALRTNLDYYLKGNRKKVILVTSSIEGEGKSFNSLNLAMSYAQLGRPTVLVDFDLRKSTTYFVNKDTVVNDGISSFLINKATLEDIIKKSPHEKLDYIESGPVPPNPAELLANEETYKLIEKLKDYYDYVILDTPPLAQVSDGYMLLSAADIKIIVVRQNYSKKNVFSLIMRDLKNKEVNGICVLINDNHVKGDQYGYGYGYYKKSKD